MSDAGPLPERLRSRIEEDLEPVRPLRPSWKRVLIVAPVILALVLGPLLLWEVRGDLDRLGAMLSWVPLALQIFLGLVLLALALRETIPGWHTSRGVLVAFGVVVVALHVGINLLIYTRSPTQSDAFFRHLWGCYRWQTLLGLPLLAVNACLAVRALPLHPKTAGFLGGIASGLLAEASLRLVCPVTVPAHVFVAHGGAILGLGLLGVAAGWLWECTSSEPG